MKMRFKNLAALVAAAGMAISIPGWKNPETPAGEEGYVIARPWLFGNGGYVETMKGPQKYGISWNKFVKNIDVRPQPYTEKFRVRMTNDINVDFDVTLKASPTPGMVKDLIENIGENWYERIRPEFESISRKAIAKYRSDDGVQNLREKIAYDIWHGWEGEIEGKVIKYNGMQEVVNDKPITIYAITIGNIDFPDKLDTEIEEKVAAKQRLQRKSIERDIAKENAAIRVEDAKGIAKAQEIINATLTPAYLQHEAIGAAKELASSDNTTFYFVPTSTEGMGMPLVLDAPTGK